MTGTPGTGKKTVAPLAAARMGIPCASLLEQAVAARLVGANDRDAEVDTEALGRFVTKRLNGPALVYGHLLPEAIGRGALRRVAVLRCEPAVLKQRLALRGYAPEKVKENVEAELIGLLSARSAEVWGRRGVADFDTTVAPPAATAAAVAGFLSGARPGPLIDWLPAYASASKLCSLLA